MLKYCPVCYTGFETEENVCPQCGSPLKKPLTEEESEEWLELLMTEIRA